MPKSKKPSNQGADDRPKPAAGSSGAGQRMTPTSGAPGRASAGRGGPVKAVPIGRPVTSDRYKAMKERARNDTTNALTGGEAQDAEDDGDDDGDDRK